MASGDFIVDGLRTLEAGTNSGVAPTLLLTNQTFFATNATFRGGYITHRPPIRKMTLSFESDAARLLAVQAYFQGASFYQPDTGNPQLVASIGGRLFSFTPDQGSNAAVMDITIPGDPNPTTAVQAWLWQSERWLIITDGQSLPLFYDGATTRRSQGPSQVVATTTGWVAPEIGQTVVGVGLTAPYTGPFDVPVLAIRPTGDAATYIIKRNGVSVANATLKTVLDVSGAQASGQQVLAIPARVGSIPTTEMNVETPPCNVLNGFYRKQLDIASPVDIPVPNTLQFEDVLSFRAATQTVISEFVRRVKSAVGDGCPFQSPYYFSNLIAGSPVTYNNPNPNTVIGTLQSGFVPPAQGASVNVILDTAYTGPEGAVVWVGDGQYQIYAYTDPGVINVIDLQNVNDTFAAGMNTVYPNPTDLLSIPELPPGRMGTYGLGRNWMSLVDGRSFIASDIVGGSSGSPLYNNRDAVLRTSENTYLAGGGAFVIPGNVGDIRFMRFTATLDASLGQGPLEVGTPFSVFSCQAPVDRLTWQDLTNPILTQSLIGNGGLSQNGSIVINGDIVMRAIDGIRSLILARRDFATWGNVPQSREVDSVLRLDNSSLLQFCSAIQFDNRLLMTCLPTSTLIGVIHQGTIALNFDPISSLRGKAASIYDGLTSGTNVFQYVTGIFNGVQRAFSFSFNQSTSEIELWEQLPTAPENNFDNTSNPILWSFESAAMFNNIKGKGPFDMVELLDGEIQLSEIRGTVNIQAWYRPDYSQCWQPWINFNVCADNTGDTSLPDQQRTRLGLGTPDIAACDPTTNQPYRAGNTFQVRFQFSGSCKFMGATFKARPFTQSKLAPVSCDQICDTVSPPAPGETCVECLDQGTCIQFPLVLYNFGLGKMYSNPLLGIEVVCPNGETVISYVQPGTVNFQLPYPPDYAGDYPPLIMGCASGGQVVRNVPSGATQEMIDAIVEDMIMTCATAIAIANAPCRTMQFASEAVYFNKQCEAGSVLVYNGTLPEWITLDEANERLVGAAKTFFGYTLAEANATAQANIDSFGNAAVANETLKCVTLDWSNLVWSVINVAVAGSGGTASHSESGGSFQNTSIANPGGAAPANSIVQVQGDMTYSGPLQNCNLAVTISGVIGQPNQQLKVIVTWNVVNSGPPPGSAGINANMPFANGTYNFPFFIPISTGQPINVQVTNLTTFDAAGGGCTMTGLITTL